jgi:hypothetical protein
VDGLELFTAALGLGELWRVSQAEFDEESGRLDLRVVYSRGARFSCSVSGCGRGGCPVHDTVERSWRHLDFFQYKVFCLLGCHGCGVRSMGCLNAGLVAVTELVDRLGVRTALDAGIGSVLVSVPRPASTTAEGVARRFTPQRLAGVEAGVGCSTSGFWGRFAVRRCSGRSPWTGTLLMWRFTGGPSRVAPTTTRVSGPTGRMSCSGRARGAGRGGPVLR